jgi:hypothetical protein
LLANPDSGAPADAACLHIFSGQISLRGKPKLHIASRGTTVLYPDFVGTLEGKVALLQFSRRHLVLACELADRLHRRGVADLRFQPSIALGTLAKLAA